MFFEQKLKQGDIANRLGISRFQVARLLRAAEKEGNVEIKIVNPFHNDTDGDLGAALENLFGLQEAIVVNAPPVMSTVGVSERLGRVGAAYLRRTLQDRDVLGVSWGDSLSAVVRALTPAQSRLDLEVVQTTGSSQEISINIAPTELVRRLAEILGGRYHILNVPIMLANEKLRDEIIAEPDIASALKFCNLITVILTDIGALQPEPSSLFARAARLSQAELAYLRHCGIVGEISSLFFDRNGGLVDNEMSRRIVGISASQYRACQKVIAVTGGPDKPTAILAAIKGKLVNVLITDRASALAILKARKEEVTAAGQEAQEGTM
jgi:DNA-binding transcriptional regulator LsrR (DeoR family)